MNKCKTFILVAVLLVATGILVVAGNKFFFAERAKPIAENSALPAWEIPIAAGVWYPDRPLAEKPMRYYRARCWPGCHVGSSYGAFPETPLEADKPIWPTSTIDNYTYVQNGQTISPN